MELAKIALIQIVILFLMIFLGWLLTKLKLIGDGTKKGISNILLYIVVPCMIINSYIGSDEVSSSDIWFCFLLSLIAMVTGLIIVMVVTHFWKYEGKAILQFAAIFSNSAYMGFPLIEAMYGSVGLIYASAFVSVFNVILWTFGYSLVSRTFNIKTVFINLAKTPAVYALIVGLIIFFTQKYYATWFTESEITGAFVKVISSMGAMTTPLSMIITGMIIATSKIKNMLKNWYVWIICALKLVIIPFTVLGILALLRLGIKTDPVVYQVVFILEACPCASITSVFATKFGFDEDVAVAGVVFTTLLSIAFLPLFAYLAGTIFC